MDLTSVVTAFASAVVGGLLTSWASIWAPRREMRAAGLDALDSLTEWNDTPLSTDADQVALLRKHLAARSSLINGGGSPGMVERFNIAAMSYAAWAWLRPDLATPGTVFVVDSAEDEHELDIGQRLLTVAYAARATLRYSLLHPVSGRFVIAWFVLRRRRFPTPGGHVPAGIHDDGNLRATFREMKQVRRNRERDA